MQRDLLTLRFEADGDWIGELRAAVQFRGFSGEGSAWFNVSALEEFR